MTNMAWAIVVVFLTAMVVVLTWLLLTTPATAPTVSVATTTPTTPATNNAAGVQQNNKVVLESPKPGEKVGDTFDVSGKAIGPWYFEASFPVQVRDPEGNVLARTHASAQGDWMTSGFVPFTTTVNIDPGYHGPATLILMKDNPSGLPENEDAVEFPIVIK